MDKTLVRLLVVFLGVCAYDCDIGDHDCAQQALDPCPLKKQGLESLLLNFLEVYCLRYCAW